MNHTDNPTDRPDDLEFAVETLEDLVAAAPDKIVGGFRSCGCQI